MPLLIFGDEIRQRFTSAISKSAYSQFQVFPTLLAAMGFGDDVVAAYGKPLWTGPESGVRQFLSGSIFSDNFAWNVFDLNCGIDLP